MAVINRKEAQSDPFQSPITENRKLVGEGRVHYRLWQVDPSIDGSDYFCGSSEGGCGRL